VAPVRLATDGAGVRINVLDRLISTTGGAAGVGAGQTHLLRAIPDEGLGRPSWKESRYHSSLLGAEPM
jgi:hypothetical protein